MIVPPTIVAEVNLPNEPLTVPVDVSESTKASFQRTPVEPKSTSLSEVGANDPSAISSCLWLPA